MLCSLSNKISEDKLKSIQNLEKEIGRALLAFNCHDIKPAKLSETELSKIRKLENDLSVSLVAVDA